MLQLQPAVPQDYDCVHLAAADHIDSLIDELRQRGADVVDMVERLIFTRGAPGPAAWAQNSWLEPREITIGSIGDGARALRAIQRNWALHSVAHHRRAQLIAERLPAIRFKPLSFPAKPPAAALGAWTLIERDRIIASTHPTSAFVDGIPIFDENRDDPPNRAYLKLWEALTLARRRPDSNDRCLDLGAAPGGWSWVLADCGARVISVDRAALDPTLGAHPRIEHRRCDAFRVRREDVGDIDWICSDLVAYPQRLLALARYWSTACPKAAIILTIKCQGTVDAMQIARFNEIEGARLLHLAHNKHELTFFRLPGSGPPEAATVLSYTPPGASGSAAGASDDGT